MKFTVIISAVLAWCAVTVSGVENQSPYEFVHPQVIGHPAIFSRVPPSNSPDGAVFVKNYCEPSTVGDAGLLGKFFWRELEEFPLAILCRFTNPDLRVLVGKDDRLPRYITGANKYYHARVVLCGHAPAGTEPPPLRQHPPSAPKNQRENPRR